MSPTFDCDIELVMEGSVHGKLYYSLAFGQCGCIAARDVDRVGSGNDDDAVVDDSAAALAAVADTASSRKVELMHSDGIAAWNSIGVFPVLDRIN